MKRCGLSQPNPLCALAWDRRASRARLFPQAVNVFFTAGPYTFDGVVGGSIEMPKEQRSAKTKRDSSGKETRDGGAARLRWLRSQRSRGAGNALPRSSESKWSDCRSLFRAFQVLLDLFQPVGVLLDFHEVAGIAFYALQAAGIVFDFHQTQRHLCL